MLKNPPESFISAKRWDKLLPAERPEGYVPVVFGRLRIDEVIIGHIPAESVAALVA